MTNNVHVFIKKKHIIWVSIVLAVAVVAAIAGHNAQQRNAERELEMFNFQLRLEWFSRDPMLSSISFYLMSDTERREILAEYRDKGYNGITDPIVIEYIRRWEEEGIAGWSDVDRSDLDKIMDRIIEGNYGDQITSDAYALLFGGYDIFGETDMRRFVGAIQIINANINNLDIQCIGKDTWMRFELGNAND